MNAVARSVHPHYEPCLTCSNTSPLASLEPVASLLYKYSFSKYAQCLEKLAYPKGVRI